jgi:hypothetical protein
VIGIGQNRPLGELHAVADACQSPCVMKPSSGVKPPMPEHDQIALLARADAQSRQRPGPRQRLRARFAFEQKRFERSAAVWIDQMLQVVSFDRRPLAAVWPPVGARRATPCARRVRCA